MARVRVPGHPLETMALAVVRKSKTSYERKVRWCLLAACSLGLALSAGCFKPDVKNGGFACSMTDNPPCPQGFFCVGGLCEDHPGTSTDGDMATGTGGNGGGGGSGGGGGGSTMLDMAHGSQDLSSTDMAQSPMCGAQLSACNGNSDCCNMVCFANVCVF